VVGGVVIDITTADLDGDAVPDLGVLIEDLRLLRVYLNDALPGQFGFSLAAAASTSDEPETVDTGDIDADKDLDLYVTSRSLTARGVADGLVEVFGNELQGQQPTLLAPISVAVGPDPTSLAIADFDLDGDIDAATADTGGDTVSILDNAAGPLVYLGALGPGTAPASLVTLDADGGGEADLAVIATEGSGSRVVRLFRNDSASPGPLVFAVAQTITTSGVPRLLRVADLDRNGRDDLVILTEAASPRGALGGAASTWLAEAPSPADLDGSGVVDAADLAALIGAWGLCPAHAACPADLTGDGEVGAADLAILIGSWG
jgi:hypothetical protein